MSGIIAMGSKTIVDLSDGQSLSAYIGSNQPRIQALDQDTGTINPDWTASPYLVLTPVIYANSREVALNASGLTVTWKRKLVGANESSLVNGETVSGNVLTVKKNVLSLAATTGGMLTYVANVSYADPELGVTVSAKAEISFALVKNGTGAKTCWISGDQVFKVAADGTTVTPAAGIELTANCQGCAFEKWQYKTSGGTWADYPVASKLNSNPITVAYADSIWNGTTASLRAVTSLTESDGVEDITSLYKVYDGGKGDDASVVFLTNEAFVIPVGKDGKVGSALTFTSSIVAYTGTEKVTPAVQYLGISFQNAVAVVGNPDTGIRVDAGSANSNHEIPLTITVNANYKPAEKGQLNIPITSPVQTTLLLCWGTAKTGADGAPSVVMSLYGPDGLVFTNHNAPTQDSKLTIAAAAYQGSTAISSGATYVWYKFINGSWTVISGETGSSLKIAGTDVAATLDIKCEMSYGGAVYTDVITLQDKTDNYQAEIESTGGDIFKNSKGETVLICRLWQSGVEVDAQKSTVYALAANAPSGPSAGDFYYQLQASGAVTKLMRYSGSKWEDVTSSANYMHEKTYTWYKRDRDGNSDGTVFATGKVIHVTDTDVETKAVFVCEVS